MNEITRRGLVRRLAAGVPLAAVLADPLLARAAASGLETVSIKTADGRTVSGALARPEATAAPAVMLIHEWWGLNDQIKAVAAAYAENGYLALALDMYDGKVAADDDRDAAKALMQAVDAERGVGTVVAWSEWLRDHDAGSGKLGTVGWCFGGGWSLNAAISTPVDACVIYYGRVNKTAEQVSSLSGPVQGHFATRDSFINAEMVGGFEKAMDQAGKTYETYWYEADHAFANPTGARYDDEDAKLAWARTMTFLAKHLKG